MELTHVTLLHFSLEILNYFYKCDGVGLGRIHFDWYILRHPNLRRSFTIMGNFLEYFNRISCVCTKNIQNKIYQCHRRDLKTADWECLRLSLRTKDGKLTLELILRNFQPNEEELIKKLKCLEKYNKCITFKGLIDL